MSIWLHFQDPFALANQPHFGSGPRFRYACAMGDDDNDADVPLPREGCAETVTPTQSLLGSDTEEAPEEEEEQKKEEEEAQQPSDKTEEEEEQKKEGEEAQQPSEEEEKEAEEAQPAVADENMEALLDQLRALVRRAEWSEELEQLQAIVDRFEFEDNQ